MKPYIHARISAKKFGGYPQDYIHIHDFIDSSKTCMADPRHRAVLHSTLGCFLVEKAFGHTLINSNGKEVSTRDVAEGHIIDDLGFIPPLDVWLDKLPLEPWMSGAAKKDKSLNPCLIRKAANNDEDEEERNLKAIIDKLKEKDL